MTNRRSTFIFASLIAAFSLLRIVTIGRVTITSQSFRSNTLSLNSHRWPQGTFWNRRSCNYWAVTRASTPILQSIQRVAALEGWCIVVVAADDEVLNFDSFQFADESVVYLSREKQEELGRYSEYVKNLPRIHLSRKNIAYLYAIANGAQYIWDFEDANIFPSNETVSRYTNAGPTITALLPETQNNSMCNVFNPYPFFQPSEDGIWPRGYPLNNINDEDCHRVERYCKVDVPSHRIGIVQSIENTFPDVDNLCRLIYPHLPVTFAGAPEDYPVALPPNTMAPMNTRATLFSRNAMWSLFLPFTVHDRVSDIWRSYIAQTLLRNCGLVVLFDGPHITQKNRDEQTCWHERSSKQQLYENSGKLVSFLNEWNHNQLDPSLEGAWKKLFTDLHERGFVGLKDIEAARLWLLSLQAVGYEFPIFDPASTSKRLLISEGGKCKQWKDTFTNPTQPLPLNSSKGKRFNDVVLVGQFNFATLPRYVIHWVQRWHEVFEHIDVRGPFDDRGMMLLRRAGINVFRTTPDRGVYSPMQTVADSLRLYANNTAIRGVIMSHDDLLFNISRMVELGFPSDDTIMGAFDPKELSQPLLTVYGNRSFRLESSSLITPVANFSDVLFEWLWWANIMPNIEKAAINVTNRLPYMDTDGGLPLYRNAPSDFIYVPTSLSNQFAEHASWMFRNNIMLEMAMPTVVGRLKQQFGTKVATVNLCTDYSVDRGDVIKSVASCLQNWTGLQFGLYHPLKITILKNKKFDALFDSLVLGEMKRLIEKLPDFRNSSIHFC